MQTSQVESTYEEKLQGLAALGVATHEVCWSSDRYHTREVVHFYSEENARKFALILVEAARASHDEETLHGSDSGWCAADRGNGMLEVCTRQEMEEQRGWMIQVSCLFAQSPYNENEFSNKRRKFVFGHRYGANRLASPESKVFVCIGGRDCDGYRYSSVHEFTSLRDAAEYVEESAQWADGAEGHSVISQDEYEMYS